MNKSELKKLTGFESFFSCFAWLKRERLDEKSFLKCKSEVVPVLFGKPVPHLKPFESNIPIQDIKLGALEEVFRCLPSKMEIDLISQSISERLPMEKRREVFEILSKIPAK